MKTFTKALLAACIGVAGLVDSADAAVPYLYQDLYQPGSYGSGYGAGSRYGHNAADDCRTERGYGRSAYGYSPSYDARHRTLPYPAARATSYGGRNDDCGPTLPSKSSRLSSRDRYDSRYEDRYDGSPRFEPWRPASTSHDRGRRNW